MKLKIAVVLMLTVGIVNCSVPETANESKDIGTDLESSRGEAPRLFWVSGDHIFRGLCRAIGGVTPIIRPNCTDQVTWMSYDTFVERLDNGLTSSVKDLEHTFDKQRAAIAPLLGEVNDMIALLDLRIAEVDEVSESVIQARGVAVQLKMFLEEYTIQIGLIEDELDTFNDPGLAQQREEMIQEMLTMQTHLEDNSQKIQLYVVMLGEIRMQITWLNIEIANALETLNPMQGQFADTLIELNQARSDLDGYETTLMALNHRLVYRVVGHIDGPVMNAQKPFVRRFDDIFTQ